MPRLSPYRPFTPDPAQMACAPWVSGNTINGLGEDEVRPPRTVYWSLNPDDIPHGQMQRWFFTVDPGHPGFGEERMRRRAILDAPLPEVAEEPVMRSPEEWTGALDRFVADGVCDKVGVTPLSQDWIFEGYEAPWQTIIVAGFQHDYDEIAKAPAPQAGVEVMRQYSRAAAAAKEIAGWLRRHGWDAAAVTGPMTGALAMVPAAIAAGFGELGKHGSIINPEFGSSFRLSAVMTNAPFASTPSQDHGIDGFCQNCRICEDACPPEALFPEKQTVRGVEKWYVDFDKCLPFFNQTQGCAICIAVCPWSRPGVGLNLAEKLARRAERLGD
ncbi:MAG: 4Fe-4S dicluster domain-containing protein [Pseudomonadota bacterium]